MSQHYLRLHTFLTSLHLVLLSPLVTLGTCAAHAIIVRKPVAWASISARSAMLSLKSSHWSLRMTLITQTTLTATIVGQSYHVTLVQYRKLHITTASEYTSCPHDLWQRIQSLWCFLMRINVFYVHRKELTAEARELKGELYCLPCHDKMGVPICGACRRPIEGRVVNAMGKQWHVEVCKQGWDYLHYMQCCILVLLLM